MKVNAEFVVMRNTITNEVIDAKSISDMYDEIGLEYPAELFSKEELENELIRIWGKDRYIINGAHYLQQYVNDGYVRFQYEAKDLPSIGKIKVSCETMEVEIN